MTYLSPISSSVILAPASILTLCLSKADWHDCLLALFFSLLFSHCCAPLNPALMHLITSRQSGSSWLIHSRSMPERNALYVTLLSSPKLCRRIWVMSAEADEYVSRALFAAVLRISNKAGWESPLWLSSGFNRDISLELAATFLSSTDYPQVRLAAPVWTLALSKLTPKILAPTIIFRYSGTRSIWISGP